MKEGHEVIVVDDCSPDRAAEIAAQFPFVKLIRHTENQGYGGANNTGIRAATGEYVFLLNSDTVLDRASVIELGRCAMSSGTIGICGPMSNYVGYEQRVEPTMSDLANLSLFCTDFAHREAPDRDVSMVVGFAAMVPKRLFEEHGYFDGRYGKALFEDTDRVHQFLRERYRAVICPRSFVFHEGSKSLGRTGEHTSVTMARNGAVFQKKWKLDKESGFTQFLAGECAGPITFDESKRPETLIKEMKRLAAKHKVCVAMIGRDEARCVSDALESLLGIFFQVVFVDTGSEDTTVDIVKSKGAEVYVMTWKDSFSIARNFSLSKCTGKWCFWIDCDDVVPFQTLLTVLRAIDAAPPHIAGFVMPVQFVDGVPGAGTRVDHVKVFRLDPRHYFEGRLHEQILPSIRATGGEVARLDAPVIHQNYDSSPEGQAKKRKRDRRLLRLELQERPGHPFVLFNVGMTAFFSGRFRVAIGWLRRCLAVSKPEESHVRKAYALYAEALHRLGNTDEAIGIAEGGIHTVGEDPELRFNLGRYLAERGHLAEAKANYEAINPDISSFFCSIDAGIITFKRFLNLGAVCFGMGLQGQAKDYLRQAVRSNPYHPACALALYEAGMKTGDIGCAKEAAEALRQVQGYSEQWTMAMAAIAEAAGTGSDNELIRLSNLLPQAIGPSLVLARRLLQAGRLGEALQILPRLEYFGCAEAAHYLAEITGRSGNFEEALNHVRVALQLEPGRTDSIGLYEAIELAREDMKPLPPFAVGIGDAVLVGPHVGRLGEATLNNSVIVVTFNSQKTIRECVERVLRTLGEKDELIVVENGSTDGTPAILQSLAEGDARMRLLPQKENLGYSKACNVGLLASRGARPVALNPDAFVSDGWLEGLASGLSENVAAVGPVSDNIAGDQFVGHFVKGRPVETEDLYCLLHQEQAGKVLPTKLVMGVCVMMRRDLLDKHGLLCEETELGADDLEFSWRTRMLGYELRVVPSVFVHHVGQASFATLPSLEARKRIRQSDRALVRILLAYYGEGNIPSSMELWGCEIFAEALARAMPASVALVA